MKDMDISINELKKQHMRVMENMWKIIGKLEYINEGE